MEKHPRIIIAACLTVTAVCLVFILVFRGQQTKAPPDEAQNDSYSPPAANAEVPRETSVGSPDGKWALKMREEEGETGVAYIFWLLNLADGSQKEIFRKTVTLGSALSIPLNTFSPDDKYIFLKETGEGGIGYFLLSASGTPLDKDALTLEISGLFADKYPDYIITDVTGWGGVNLIVINTDKSDGGTGPSFWFDVSSHSFIQLSTRFD